MKRIYDNSSVGRHIPEDITTCIEGVKEPRVFRIIMIHRGSYGDYHEDYLFCYNDELGENEIKMLIDQASLLSKQEDMRFYDQFAKLLIKHGRRDLIEHSFGGESPFAVKHNVSKDLANNVDALWKTKKSCRWQEYLFEASNGKLKYVKPDLDFEYEPEW